MKKEPYIPWEQLEEVKRNREDKASSNILDLATWLRVIGWIAIIVGAILYLTDEVFLGRYIAISGVVLVFVARVLNGIGVMVEKSVENTRNSAQMLALMKQMKKMMERQAAETQKGASAAPDENGPQHAEEQAD